MEKNRLKVTNKIKRFYQRERKAQWFKVPKELLSDIKTMDVLVKNKMKYLDRHPSWCRKPTIQIGEDGTDFVRMMATVRIDYTYPKYGNV